MADRPGRRAATQNDSWIAANQAATRATLERYRASLRATGASPKPAWRARIAPERMPTDEAAAEQAIRRAILEPGTVDALPPARKPPQPVVLWLYPTPQALDNRKDKRQPNPQDSEDSGGKARTAARSAAAPSVMTCPTPAMPSSCLFIPSDCAVCRIREGQCALDDDENDDAAKAATDMDTLSVASDGSNTASKVRFDLDLPSEAHDDFPLADGILLPEWDWKKKQLKKNHCSLVLSRPARCHCPPPAGPPGAARPPPAQPVRITGAPRRWLKNQPEARTDMDACVRAWSDRQAGHHTGASGNYLSCERHERDLACLVLADLSLSTDAWVGNEARVIDVIKDSLMLFSEALGATGDSSGCTVSPRDAATISAFTASRIRREVRPGAARRIAALRPGLLHPHGRGDPSRQLAAGTPAQRAAAAADPLRRQTQRPRSVRGPLRHRGHPHGADRGIATWACGPSA